MGNWKSSEVSVNSTRRFLTASDLSNPEQFLSLVKKGHDINVPDYRAEILKKIIQFKPSLLDSDLLETTQFSHKCVPCLQLLLSAGFRFDITSFRDYHGFFDAAKSSNFEDDSFLAPDEIYYRDYNEDELAWGEYFDGYCFRYYPLEDRKSFAEFQKQNGRLSQPRSLKKLAQWSIYAACGDKPVKEIVDNIESEQGLYNIVEKLIQAGAQSTCDHWLRHPLHLAIEGRHVKTARVLILNFKEAINAEYQYGNSALKRALEGNQPTIVDLLLRHGAEVDPSLIEIAVDSGLVDCLKKLIQFKPSLMYPDPCEYSYFSEQSRPCWQLLLCAGFCLDWTRFEGVRGLLHLVETECSTESLYCKYQRYLLDSAGEEDLMFSSCVTNSWEDVQAFKEFQDQNLRQSQPLSLMQLAQWSFYSACGDTPIGDIVDNIQLPKSIASFLLFDYLN
ncbi:hypothetical protein HDE_07473 [Halotydeus destructor]|nr:hypothetical protein HDE_07473 [Halotydeus destructor]